MYKSIYLLTYLLTAQFLTLVPSSQNTDKV